MKKITLTLLVFLALSGLAYSGSEPAVKEVQQAPPCPEWYGDNELNISLWGTYASTGTEYAPNLDLVDLVQSTTEGHTVFGTFDKYPGRRPCLGWRRRHQIFLHALLWSRH